MKSIARLALGVCLALYGFEGCGSPSSDLFGEPAGSSTTGGAGRSGTGNEAGSAASGAGGLDSGPPSGSGGGGGGAGGGGISDAAVVINPDTACGASKESTSQIPLDVFIMLDKSGSMTCPAADDACMNGMGTPSRWDAVSDAINGFVNSPVPAMAGVGVGLGFFPLGTDCTVASYASPVVPIAALPGNAAAIGNAIMTNMPGGGTPTTPALLGAIEYARAYTMQQNGKRAAAVLLVTDGNPNGCASTVQNGAAAAQAGFMGTPQIKTFVVGLGTVATLDAIALGGSGGTTHYIPASGDVAGALSMALTEITGTITCAYAIPRLASMPVDPNKVNVQITVGAGSAPKDVGKVANMAACGSLGGWYYDDAAAPTQILLCAQTCDALKANPNSSVQVLFGCPSTPP